MVKLINKGVVTKQRMYLIIYCVRLLIKIQFMAKFGKWIGGGLGWALGGPIGAILGYTVGAYIDGAQDEFDVEHGRYESPHRYHTNSGDFGMSLLILSAAVMKADGKVMKSELDYVKQFFTHQFGSSKTNEFLRVLKDLLDKDFPLREVCEQIRHNMRHPLRLQLLHYLFGISKADGHVHTNEIEMIARIATYLGISVKDFESIKAMFVQTTESPFKILEVDTNATNDEIKKAYRKMAVKYHPDKVSQLGEDVQQSAKDKFQKVQQAYETIKKERAF